MTRSGQFDVIVIGGGPGGMSAACWSADLGGSVMLYDDAPVLGGLTHSIYNPITNYLGVKTENGEEMAARFIDSLASFDLERTSGTRIVEVDGLEHTVRTADGTTVGFGSLIVATGVRRRRLNVEGEREFEGRGILLSGAKDPAVATGKKVVIVGGGDAAVENALILSKHARHVTVVHWRSSFAARDEFLDEARSRSNIEWITDAEAVRFAGGDTLGEVTVRSTKSASETAIPTDLALIRIGVVPNSELLAGKADMDRKGFIRVDTDMRTSLKDVYAIGDVVNPAGPSIAAAAGQGAAVAKIIATSR